MPLLSPSSPRRPSWGRLRVAAVERPVPGSAEITFDVPDGLAGDYLRYDAGQYLTLRAVVGGERVAQSYSIILPPHEAWARQQVTVAASEIPGGRMSPWLVHDLATGDEVEVLPPMGDFRCDRVEGPGGRHVAVAGGSGITPVLAVVGHVLYVDPQAQVRVVLSHRGPASALGLDRLGQRQEEHPGRLEVVPVWSREAPDGGAVTGRLDARRLAALGVADADEWWLCGPDGLVATTRSWLLDEGADPEHIHTEVFFAGEPT